MNNKTIKLDGRSLFLVPILLEFPLSVVQWTHLSCFEPARDAVEVKSMCEKQKRQHFQKAESGDTFLNHRVLGSGSPKGIRQLLPLSPHPLSTLQWYRVLV